MAGATPEKKTAFVSTLVEAGADAAFHREGLLFWCVPLWIVQAYVEARFAKTEVLTALAIAAVGLEMARECRAHPEVLIWTMARGWVSRLGELERQARGITELAA